MKKILKKLVFLGVIAAILLFFSAGTEIVNKENAAYAAPASCTNDEKCTEGKVCVNGQCIETLKETLFNVNQILDPNPTPQTQSYFAEGKTPIVDFVTTVINFALRVIGSIAIILFIIAGFRFMTSEGNQQKVDEAKEMFKYTIIGLIITFLAYIIVIFVQSLFISSEQQPTTPTTGYETQTKQIT